MAFDHALMLTDQQQAHHGFYRKLSSERLLAGFGSIESITCSLEEVHEKLTRDDWYLGFLSYELKNELYPQLTLERPPLVEFPALHFFCPRWMVRLSNDELKLGFDDSIDDEASAHTFAERILCTDAEYVDLKTSDLSLKPLINQDEYTRNFKSLQKHIQRGDIYEVNFCMEFADNHANINPAIFFTKLLQRSPMPFSAFLKHNNQFALCASPERYLTKLGDQIFSMPMKGTAPRGHNQESDEASLNKLVSSIKERSENIMITDLVRNDMSRVAAKGSVRVDELCGAYPFPGVFQVVSTISAQLKNPHDWVAPIKATFPMGSMTGAPKLSAMKLIDSHETRSRGLFSGAIGYISPNKDFDFNVVIRTLFYDAQKHTASYYAGSAITALSVADEEYRECLLKAQTVTGQSI